MPPPNVYTVSQVTAYIKSLFVSDLLMGDVWLSGEVSGFTQASSGHCYFTLKDGGAVLKAVIWRTQAARSDPAPQRRSGDRPRRDLGLRGAGRLSALRRTISSRPGRGGSGWSSSG